MILIQSRKSDTEFMNRSESKYFNTAVKMDRALMEILEKKDFEYITVKEICEKANVNRSTFYLHYNNTVDLLEETGRLLEEDFLAYFSVSREKLVNEQLLNRILTCDLSELNYVSEEFIHPFLKYVQENKRVFITVLSHAKSFGCDSTFDRMFTNIFDPILSRFNYPESHRKFVMMFYLSGVVAVVTEWLRGDCTESINEISEIIMLCIHGRNQNFETNLSKLNNP